MNDAITGSALGAVGHQVSMIDLFFQADPIVKSVMIGLLLASIWCWAIIIDKLLRLRGLQSRADAFEERFWSGGSLEELYERIGKSASHPMARLFASAMHEWRRSTDTQFRPSQATVTIGLPSRLHNVATIAIQREMDGLERGLGFLATVGSTAPFVGLFGTVWGIMNSFQAIAMTKNTSLAVVAPGIAEALFATALGLVAAIPAVIAYNKFSTDLGRYASRLEGFAGELNAVLGRKLEQGGV